MIRKIEFHEDGSIKSLEFVEGAIPSEIAFWLRFTSRWNIGNRDDAVKMADERVLTFNG